MPKTIAVALLRMQKSSLTSDNSNRFAIYEKVVNQSKSLMKALKCDIEMVVAPEYFYSSVDTIGQNYKQLGPVAMTRSDKHSLYSKLKELSRKSGSTVLVTGSIYYKKGRGGKKGLNMCPILKNGEFLHKYYKKMDDGAVSKGITGGIFTYKNTDPIFKVKDVVFGIEICGDHSQANLKGWLTSHGKTVDVQLLISDSDFPKASSMGVSPGGYFIQCDLGGEANAALGVYSADQTGKVDTTFKNSKDPDIVFQSSSEVTVEIHKITV